MKYSRIPIVAVVVCLGSVTVTGEAPDASSFAPADWDVGIRLREAVDVNADPHTVEISLTAKVASVDVAEGKRVVAWTYDGGLLGPPIRTQVGDRLIVHFKNELAEPTTVHWHGVRVPIEMDGVPGISQPAVQTGDSFTYDFVVRDAGLYWYHPHVMSAAQVGWSLRRAARRGRCRWRGRG